MHINILLYWFFFVGLLCLLHFKFWLFWRVQVQCNCDWKTNRIYLYVDIIFYIYFRGFNLSFRYYKYQLNHLHKICPGIDDGSKCPICPKVNARLTIWVICDKDACIMNMDGFVTKFSFQFMHIMSFIWSEHCIMLSAQLCFRTFPACVSCWYSLIPATVYTLL